MAFLVIATGFKFNTGLFTTLNNGAVLNEKKEVKVGPCLQVDGFQNIFAM